MNLIENAKIQISKIKQLTIFRFVLVGIANTIFGYTIFFVTYNYILRNLKYSYQISTALNVILGSILSYFLNKHFTFKKNDKKKTDAILFVLNISICYLISYGPAKYIVGLILQGVNETLRGNIAGVLGMVIFTLANYFGQKLIVFNPKTEKIIEDIKRSVIKKWKKTK